MNIGFAGSDDFSLRILSGLTEMIADGSFNLSLVLTMPARHRGRGQILADNPIYLFSKKNNFFVETIAPDEPVGKSLEDRISNLDYCLPKPTVAVVWESLQIRQNAGRILNFANVKKKCMKF